MWVCLCRGVTSGTIARVVNEGARTVRDVTSACGAGSDCSKCRPTILRMVATAQQPPDRQLEEFH